MSIHDYNNKYKTCLLGILIRAINAYFVIACSALRIILVIYSTQLFLARNSISIMLYCILKYPFHQKYQTIFYVFNLCNKKTSYRHLVKVLFRNDLSRGIELYVFIHYVSKIFTYQFFFTGEASWSS